MMSIADRALLLRIQDPDSKPVALIDAVTHADNVSGCVLDALDDRLEREYLAWRDVLPYLQKHSRKKLVQALCERMSPNTFDATELIKMGYESDGLEEQLCKDLYNTFKKREGLYSHILGALSDHGSEKSLEMMEVIKHELFPIIKTNRIVTEPIRGGLSERNELTTAEAELLIDSVFLNDFSGQLESAIKLLRLRGVDLPGEQPSIESTATHPLFGRRGRVRSHMAKARELLAHHPESSLNSMRKAAEAICKDVLDADFKNSTGQNKKPADAYKLLDEMINRIRKEGLVPPTALACLETLQKFGNLGSHDQEEPPASVSVEVAESVFGQLKTAAEWYESVNLQSEPGTD